MCVQLGRGGCCFSLAVPIGLTYSARSFFSTLKAREGFTSKIVHSDRLDTIEHGSLHKPVHSTVAYGYEDARDLAAVFQGKQSGFTYGRQVNPTIEALQSKISKMENGLASV